MALRLDNFKQVISSTILTRGRDYYRKGHVVDLSQDDEDVWIAQVQGTELYEVIIEQAPDGSLNVSCSCPYDDDYCKHVAAVLYAIEEAYPDVQPGKSGKRKPKTPKPREDVAPILSTSRRERSRGITAYSREDRAFPARAPEPLPFQAGITERRLEISMPENGKKCFCRPLPSSLLPCRSVRLSLQLRRRFPRHVASRSKPRIQRSTRA